MGFFSHLNRAINGYPSSLKLLVLFSVSSGGLVAHAEPQSDNGRDTVELNQMEPKKKRVVVLGTGWAGTSFLKDLDISLYDVKVISPRNYFAFTPLLPSVTCGTVEARSIVEPIQRIMKKEEEDAQRIRRTVIDCFETAVLPGQSEEERMTNLHFVIVGGGPTGVEFAAELYDFVHENLVYLYPTVKDLVKISVIQSGDHMLNMFDQRISSFAEQKFRRDAYKNRPTASTDKQLSPPIAKPYPAAPNQRQLKPSAAAIN
ncbi:unnamed protein product [Ilex paraguariensis]|uniref:FAD/NAD(P)-binding domain-containing protein n=1 Tax=Ilex paraguariensis TaxID=185542 RepID=A0ABC8SSL5_9AQUA